MLEQHCGMRMTKQSRDLATALPVSCEMGPERLSGWGNHPGREPLGALERHQGSLRTVYKAKRASSVRSAFFWEPAGARAG